MVHLNMAPNPKAPAVHFSCTLCVGLWKPFMELVYCIPLDIGIVLRLYCPYFNLPIVGKVQFNAALGQQVGAFQLT